MLRAAVKQGTKRGLEAKRYMDRGDLVPDQVILAIMKEALAEPRAARGSILDGVVRTVAQAEGLEDVLLELGRTVDGVLVFDVPEEELVRRLSGRTTCDVCQTPYSGREPNTPCPKNDGGTLVRRSDDEPESVRNRLHVFERQTAPVLDWYEEHDTRVIHIDATGKPDDVTARAIRALEA